MATEKNRKKIKDWRISSARNDPCTQSDTKSFDDKDRLNTKPDGSPKFLRTQSSGGILLSPRKSRNLIRIFGSLKLTNNSSGCGESSKSPICDVEPSDDTSLNNSPRLISQPNRQKPHTSLNQSKSMRSVDQIIDENTEFRMSCVNLDADHADISESMSNTLEFTINTLQVTTPTNRMVKCRMQQFRRRSISWDSKFAKVLKRYGYFFESQFLQNQTLFDL